MITVSTVTPVYRGAVFIPRLVTELERVKQDWQQRYAALALLESIFVIDGAVDNSYAVLTELAATRDWIRIITLSNNYGQHPATIAGILHSSGEWIATLDEDLQHDPHNIIALLTEAATQSADICYASPSSAVHGSIVRDHMSRIFKHIVSTLSGVKFIKHFNSFRLIRGSVARASAAIAGHDTYYDIVLCWFTNRIVTRDINLKDHRNLQGTSESGYSIRALTDHALRMLMTSRIKLLRIAIAFGVLAFILSIIVSLYSLYAKLYAVDSVLPPGWPSTMLAILFFGGLASLLLGVSLESISDILLASKGKPAFFVVDRSRDDELQKILTHQTSS